MYVCAVCADTMNVCVSVFNSGKLIAGVVGAFQSSQLLPSMQPKLCGPFAC